MVHKGYQVHVIENAAQVESEVSGTIVSERRYCSVGSELERFLIPLSQNMPSHPQSSKGQRGRLVQFRFQKALFLDYRSFGHRRRRKSVQAGRGSTNFSRALSFLTSQNFTFSFLLFQKYVFKEEIFYFNQGKNHNSNYFPSFKWRFRSSNTGVIKGDPH